MIPIVAMVSATPEPVYGAPKRERLRLVGEIPSPVNLGEHCRLVTRCPAAQPSCGQSHPALESVGAARLVRCPPALVDLRASASAAEAVLPVS